MKWTESHLQYLKKNYSTEKKEVLEEELSRSWGAIVTKASVLGLNRERKRHGWSEQELEILKENKEKSFEEISQLLQNRSTRSVRRKSAQLKLKSNVWRDEEIDFLKKNPHKSPEELKDILDRTEAAIAQKLREVRGTANRRFRKGWDEPDKELAYFLGIVCSDGGIYEYTFEITQVRTHKKVIDVVQGIIENRFGIPATRKEGERYMRLWASSTQFIENLSTEEGKRRGNIRSEDGEWIDFLEEKFSWVFDDEYFWSFISGLYDGDGSLVRRNRNSGIWYSIEFGIHPERSRKKIMKEFRKRGFIFKEDKQGTDEVYSIYLNGGQKSVDEFLEKIDSNIPYKQQKIEGVDIDSIWSAPLSREEAVPHMEEHHYLGKAKGDAVYYGIFSSNMLVGIAAFTKTSFKGFESVYELNRFVLLKNEKNLASKSLSVVFSEFSKSYDYDVITTFSDPNNGFTGTIYKAISAIHIGDTGKQTVFVTEDGTKYSGRFVDKVLVGKKVVRVEEGKPKQKFAIPRNGDVRKKLLNMKNK